MEKMVLNNEVFFAQVLDMLDAGHQVTIPVKGYSMLPFIRGQKDLVILEKAGEIRPDDIVLFRHAGRYVMHRILSIDGDAVDIMGDGVPYNHEHITRSQVLARAVTVLRDGKKAVDPYSARELRKVHLWQRIRPLRRYLLFIYRHLPWNRSWIKGE